MGFFKSLTSALVAGMAAKESLGFNADPSSAWCGKPYMSSRQAIEPGGQFQFPIPQVDPLLYITIQPRYSIFLESDESGSFIIDATISHIFGKAYTNLTHNPVVGETKKPLTSLDYEIFNDESGDILASSSIRANSTANLISFPLTKFTPRLSSYAITLHAHSPNINQTFTAQTSLYVLPSRKYGSAVKIDNLYGGLYVQNAHSNWIWTSHFPHGGYADGSIVTPSNISFTGLDSFAAHGFNTINIVPDGGLPDQSYPVTELATYWEHMDSLNLLNVYDMRFAFRNRTRIEEQVALWKDRDTLLMWYTADEPDGWMYDLDSTILAYKLLRGLDPYHPVSLVLNCQDFFYAEYASGADIILEDAYPVGTNVTFSTQWDTPCNSTYGDCGCDNCFGDLKDVARRLDDIQLYQANIEGGVRKPTWPTIQIFGKQEYWSRVPSWREVQNMMMLSVNHDAKGLTYWIYPSTDKKVNTGSGALGRVFASKPAIGFLFGASAIKRLDVRGEEGEELDVDASAWVVDGKVMVGVASGSYADSNGTVAITLPIAVSGVDEVLWGDGDWNVKGDKLFKSGSEGLETGLVVLNIA